MPCHWDNITGGRKEEFSFQTSPFTMGGGGLFEQMLRVLLLQGGGGFFEQALKEPPLPIVKGELLSGRDGICQRRLAVYGVYRSRFDSSRPILPVKGTITIDTFLNLTSPSPHTMSLDPLLQLTTQ